MAVAAGADTAAGRRRTVVDRDLVPDLSLRLLMSAIGHWSTTDRGVLLRTFPKGNSVRELPYW